MTTKRFNNIGIITIVCFITIWLLFSQIKINNLDKRFKLTKGIIDHFAPNGYKRNFRLVEYHYYVNGLKYNNEVAFNLCENYNLTDLSNLLVNKEFDVIYDPNTISSSNIILTINEAKKYNCTVTKNLIKADSIRNCLTVTKD